MSEDGVPRVKVRKLSVKFVGGGDELQQIVGSDDIAVSRPKRAAALKVVKSYAEKPEPENKDSDDENDDDDEEYKMDEDNDESEDEEAGVRGPSEALMADCDLGGRSVYSFQTPKSTKKMAMLAAQSAEKQRRRGRRLIKDSDESSSSNDEDSDESEWSKSGRGDDSDSSASSLSGRRKSARTPAKNQRKTPLKRGGKERGNDSDSSASYASGTRRNTRTPAKRSQKTPAKGGKKGGCDSDDSEASSIGRRRSTRTPAKNSQKTPAKNCRNSGGDSDSSEASMKGRRRSTRTPAKRSQKTPAKGDRERDSDDSEASTKGRKKSSKTPAKKTEEEVEETKPTKSRRKKHQEVSIDNMAEDYFHAHTGESLTSDHTLSRLGTPQMDQYELNFILQKTTNSHVKEKRELFKSHQEQFSKWMYQLCNGFNLLLYGLGSKRQLLECLRLEYLEDYYHLVVNGYFPSLSMKHILNSISEDILGLKQSFGNMQEQVDFIKDELEERDEHIFLIIHNIDGNMLRGSKNQILLSSLAQMQYIHILASLDHINAPLIWDQSRCGSFRWLWYDTTTYQAYIEETSYENSLMVQQSGALALSSLNHVLRSLTPNARGIFNIIVENQLENKDDISFIGISFQELYQKCREAFLINSDLTLRAQLTEFRDHKLLVSKKGVDGSELLSIPLDHATLQEFKQQEEIK